MNQKIKLGEYVYLRVNSENRGQVVERSENMHGSVSLKVSWGDLDQDWRLPEELCTDKSDCEMT